MSTEESASPSKRSQRPKITLQIPTTPHVPPPRVPPTANASFYPPNFHGAPPSSNATNPYYNPFMNMYHSKASDFMFKQFAGFKDFTMNTAKSGLSGGEKTAFWLYNKLSQWSKRWFTHIFLFLCLVCYGLLGAVMFIALELPNEAKIREDFKIEVFELRSNYSDALMYMAKNHDSLFRYDGEWLGNMSQLLQQYEAVYSQCREEHAVKENKTWSFHNALFYAGTVFTTIGFEGLRTAGMSTEKSEPQIIVRIPTIKADSESQTSGHLVILTPEEEGSEDDMEVSGAPQNVSSIRKRRNLSKNRAQATRQREKTPEPGRMGIPHEDTTTSDEEDIKAKPRSSREIEAEDNYKEMMRLLQEKSASKDPDDIDVDEIKEQRAFAEHERRRRSISPFALPSQEDIANLQRRGSFIDPTNKLLSTTYNLSPKEEDKERRNSLTIDTAQVRRGSLSPTTPLSASPVGTSTFPYPSPPSPRKQAEIIYPNQPENKFQERNLKTPNKDKTDVFTFETKDEKPKVIKTPVTTKAELQPGELVTKVIQVERSPSRKLTQDNKPVVEVKPTVPVERTPSKKSLSESRPVVVRRPSTKQPKEDQQPRAPPVKPARSKSASRFGGKTSESEMSEDQSKFTKDNAANTTKRKTVATPRRFIRNKSPQAKRSNSVTRVEDLTDKTGTGMSQTSREIIQLLQQARARSLSIPKDDSNVLPEYKHDKRRMLVTPNKSPATSRSSRGISCPKTIQIISQKEVLSSLTKAQKLDLEFEKSRTSSGYVDASQSEYTSSCYSTSPSENEYDFNLVDKTAELNRKLSLLSQEMESKDSILPNNEMQKEITTKPILRKRSSANVKKEHKKEKPRTESKPDVQKEKIETLPSKYKILREWRSFKVDYQREYDSLKLLRNRCVCDALILIIFCGIGGIMFKQLEGSFEGAYKCGTRNVKRDFIEHLWKGSHYLREEDWKTLARNKLHEFENQLYSAHEAGVTSYSGRRSWNFMNSFVYCFTVVTTIGYGHIVPATTSGRVATICYAIIGIPLFLIVLADFGKLFTRIIKFFWAFIRRLYFTGSCKQVRRTVPMQEMMKGFNMVYDVVRRPSQMLFEDDLAQVRRASEAAAPDGAEPPPKPPKPDEESQLPPPLPPKPNQQPTWVVGGPDVEVGTEPETPAPSVFEIDDEFNLPISVAITIFIVYIFAGASMYQIWEEWSFFESFYFVFISMSTIGFGDFTPKHPAFMMASILYLVFGLALTSMCINVVQVKLSDTFRQASAKLGATIGFRVADDDGALVPITPQPGEIVPVHKPQKQDENKEELKETEDKEK